MGIAKRSAKADEDGGFDACQTVEGVAHRRQASRWIVNICLELKSYRAAAEVVSGVNDGFQLYSQRIEDILGHLSSEAVGIAIAVDPQLILATALAEIAYYRVWSQDVLTGLPAGESAAVLRAAFFSADRSRALLLDVLRSANEKCLRLGASGIDAQAIEKEAAHA